MDAGASAVLSGPDPGRARWLLLIHQIPPKPDYFRVKVRRRLHRLGAVALKNSVYVLPLRDETVEDFQWLAREIVAEGGEASLCEASFVEGVSDAELVALFAADRNAEYAAIVEAARAVAPGPLHAADAEGERAAQWAGEVSRLRRRLEEVAAIDYFGAAEHGAALQALAAAEGRLRPAARPTVAARGAAAADLSGGRTWVTREGVQVDRIASAWLVRRFIDRDARFKFVRARGYRPEPGELRFDMFDAEYTHDGDRCTFETLVARFGLRDGALEAIAAMVHDIDFKERRFDRDETAGFAALIRGIALAHADDMARIERGAAVLDDLYAAFRRKHGAGRHRG
jgi:hypothetical protein